MPDDRPKLSPHTESRGESIDIETLLDDLRQRWARGEPARAEEYCVRYPQLRSQKQDLLDMLYQEMVLREGHGETPTLSDYLARFPDMEPELRVQFEIEKAMDQQAVESELPEEKSLQDTVDFDTTGAPNPALLETIDTGGSPSPATAPSKSLHKQFGDYELLDEIARGGMGVVYKARQTKANRIVALKMILAASLAGPEEIRRFFAEAEAAASLDHPNIVPVFDVGETSGRHYFSMAFVDGDSLADVVREEPLEPRRAAQLISQVAKAVEYAHKKNVIHRDLKPANILLERDGTPRVTDFGLAKRIEADSNLTATGQVMGTPSYMPPEQALGEPVGRLADVYSLGAVLYHLLTARPPFRTASVVETLRQVVDQRPVAPSQLNAAIDRDLETIVLKTLEKDAGRRYQSATEMAEDLDRYLAREPIKARPISSVERALRWARRNKAYAALMSFLILSLVAIAGVSVLAATVYRRQAITEATLREQAEDAMEDTRGQLYANHMSDLSESLESPYQLGKAREQLSTWHPGLSKIWKSSLNTFSQKEKLEDLRGWEWWLLFGNAHHQRPDRPSLDAKGNAAFSIAWNQQGLVAFGGPTDIEVVNFQRKTQRPFRAHDGDILTLDFGPGDVYLASGGQLGWVKVWRFASRKVAQLLEHPAAVGSLAFHPDGVHLATHAADGRLRIWELVSGEVRDEIESGVAPQPACDISPDGTLIAAGGIKNGEFYPVHCWDFASGEELFSFDEPAHTKPIRSVSFSPDGTRLASAGEDGVLQVWNVTSRRLDYSIDEHPQAIHVVAWSADGKMLASAGEDTGVWVWNAADGQSVRVLGGHQRTIRDLCWSPDGHRLCSVSVDGIMKAWDVDELPSIYTVAASDFEASDVKPAEAHTTLQWHPTADRLSAAYGDKMLIWNAETRQREELGDLGSHMRWNHDGSLVVSRQGNRIHLWKSDPRTLTATATLAEHQELIDVRWNPRRDSLGIFYRHGIWIWNATADSEPRELVTQPHTWIDSAGWNYDGTRVYFSTNRQPINWKVVDSDQAPQIMKLGENKARYVALAWHPFEPTVVFAGEDSNLRFMDASIPQYWYLTEPMMRVTDIAWRRDGQGFATASLDHFVRVYRKVRASDKSAKQVARFRHDAVVRRVAWNHDGMKLASLSEDGTIKIWDAAQAYEAAAYFDSLHSE